MSYSDLNQRFPLGEEFGGEIREAIKEALKAALEGEFSSHSDFPVFYVRTEHSIRERVDDIPLVFDELPEIVVQWARLDESHSWSRDDILVLDLETTGLGRGGTLAFLIGLGFYEGERYIVEQIFLPEPEAEINSFDLLLRRLEEKPLIVTFNGKSFDLPVLESRFLINNLWVPLRQHPHLDVLHLARRLWKNRAPSCNMETLEFYILGHIRDLELNIPGSLIPQTYFQFLMNGDSELIRKVFLHNRSDVLHTAALLALIADKAGHPIQERDQRIDYCALARLYASQGRTDTAIAILTALYEEGFVSAELVYDLGILYKKREDYKRSISFLAIGAALSHPPSLSEYAMLLERRVKDYNGALAAAERLLALLLSESLQDIRKIAEAKKRVERLRRKLENQKAKVNPA